MAATKTATIKIGNFTRQVTKASDDKQAVVAQSKAIAADEGLVVLVKRDYAGRWQGFAQRSGGSPAYDFDLAFGRRARRDDVRVNEGIVYIADTSAASGPVEVELVRP